MRNASRRRWPRLPDFEAWARPLAFAAFGVAGSVAAAALSRATKEARLRSRTRVETGRAGAVARLAEDAEASARAVRKGLPAGSAPAGRPGRYVGPVEERARALLLVHFAGQGLSRNAVVERSRSGELPLHPVLAHLVGGGTFEEWSRARAWDSYRGPRLLFGLWHAITRSRRGDGERYLQYLDLLSRQLAETVDPS